MLLARITVVLAAWTFLPLSGCGTVPRARHVPEAAVAAFAAGEIRGLDHAGFSRAQAQRGLWVADATRDGDTWGIYFLEPYDPDRIPVLFVHGIGGTPLDFQAMLRVLDRTKFQAWVFHYPTTLPLGAATSVLRGLLADVQRKHRFVDLVIVAHSMGGLVARGYLVAAQQDTAAVFWTLLVTFSSPWQGHASVQAGTRFMPGPPGSWTDLVPESDFLVSIRTPLRNVPHYVFFGFRRGPRLLASGSSDGSIALSSQIPRWVQDQAERCWGYDADHVGVLSDPAALARFNALLISETDRRHASRVPGAYPR